MKPLAHPRAATERVRIEEKRIARRGDVPPYVQVLTHAKGVVPLTEKQRLDLVALETAPGRCVLIRTPGTRGTSHELSLISRCRQAGYHVEQKFLAESRLIVSLYEITDRPGTVVSVEGDSEIMRLFDQVIAVAVKAGASDIHLMPERQSVHVRFRIHGELWSFDEWSHERAMKFCSVAYGILAEDKGKEATFKPAEAQDGSIRRRIEAHEYQIRYAHAPTYPEGVHLVLRLLPMGSQGTFRSLEQLGYLEAQLEMIREIVSRPSGVCLLCGTTGSGKTTTLNTMSRWVMAEKEHRISVLTIEDPPEYEIPGAVQSPVVRNKQEEKGGVNRFAEMVRSALRRDPDIIMVGEVRDGATAQAITSAIQSGHFVLSTLHTDSALGSIPRLESLGVPRDVLGAQNFIAGLIYQKLLPVLCDHCAIPYAEALREGLVDAGLAERVSSVVDPGIDRLRWRVQSRCPHCKGRGITGRTVAAEIVRPDYEMTAHIAARKDLDAWRLWRAKPGVAGMSALEVGLLKMRQGLVSPSDIEAVFGRIQRTTEEKRSEWKP